MIRMEKNTTELTREYIKNHPNIKSCLKKGLINYSSLARLISVDLKIEKKTSKEAILIAARRFHETLKKEIEQDKNILNLLSSSELEIKNKIVVLILSKDIDLEDVDCAQKEIRKDFGTFYLLEGSNSYTLITQERYLNIAEEKLKRKVIKKNDGLALVILKSSREIESTVGVVSYLTSLFAENGVNILEFLSCWTDTLFIIESKDVNKVMGFLNF